MVFGEDIITEILLRLPVKSLLRLKCVCKEWCQLIESKVFINQHFNRETNHSCLLVQYMPLLTPPHSLIYRQERCHFALFPDKDLQGTPLAHEDLYKRVDIGLTFGPVNGLFFLDSPNISLPYIEGMDNPMVLWNPAIRQLKRIIHPPKPCCFSMFHTFGFGYDGSSNDYKVICISSYSINTFGYPGYPIDATIYSLSKDSWSSPIQLNYSPKNSLCNTFINGAYYWISIMNAPYCGSILSFDMATEVYREIKGPDNDHYFSDGLFFQRVLMLCNDHLATLVSKRHIDDFNQNLYYMWIMEEEGCWVQFLTIGPYQGLGSVKGIWKKDELLIEKPVGPPYFHGFNFRDFGSVGQLLLCNVISSETKDLGLVSMSSHYHCFTYKESLVSLNG